MTRVLVINPGSTSTKVGVFDNETCVFSENVAHSADTLATFGSLQDQLAYREQCILDALEANDVTLESVDAFVGRGGGLLPLTGGVYEIGDVLLDHARTCANGVVHPANLGSQLAYRFSCVGDAKKPAFVVNPPDTDELCDCARMTGIDGVYRHVHLHALNLKETILRHAAAMGESYADENYIVCHIGGGTSISAHKKGKMIDGNDIVGGDGPMTPTRCGTIPVVEILDLVESGMSTRDVRKLAFKSGGFTDLLGTADARDVQARADAGDTRAQRVWDAMCYQIAKEIGAMACVLDGDVKAIVLGGGLVNSPHLVEAIRKSCGWIAPVFAYPGEFELEAMANGALRALSGEEAVLAYTGVPVWNGFKDDCE